MCSVCVCILCVCVCAYSVCVLCVLYDSIQMSVFQFSVFAWSSFMHVHMYIAGLLNRRMAHSTTVVASGAIDASWSLNPPSLEQSEVAGLLLRACVCSLHCVMQVWPPGPCNVH